MKKVAITQFPELDYSVNEAMNTLCTNLTFAGNDIKRILITSCQSDEGKSFTSMNVMRTLASMGNAVVLVDADLRKSVLASQYGITYDKNTLGLSHYLSRDIELSEIVYETDIVGAYMVPSGHDVPNSMQLLNSEYFNKLMESLATMFDFVIVDTPPIGAIIDAAVIARSCDGAVFVVSENKATKRELSSAKRQIETAGCTVLGSVLNQVSLRSHSNKYYNRSMYMNYGNANGYYRRDSAKRDKK